MRALQIVLALALASPAAAADKPPRWSCWLVRAYVAKYSAAVVEAFARRAGVSEEEIERARRCLK
jgi:hypothetical protein